LNIFLAPDDLVPFWWHLLSLESRYGRPGFLQLLQALHRYYDTKQDLRSRKEAILDALQQAAVLPTTQQLDGDLLRRGLEYNTVLTARDSGTSSR